VIAALFVETNGVYFGLPDVDPWDVARDARQYAGPHPVVAHPPCERWGRYWSGGPSVRVRRRLGDDGGCFAAALYAVRTWGGVLEHPEASHAWRWFGLNAPPRAGGWISADRYGGWTCCVEQGHYGHPARKATWLYAVDKRSERGGWVDGLPVLRWGPSAGRRLDDGFHSKEEARAARTRPDYKPRDRLTKAENVATPIAFRDVLLAIARRCAITSRAAA
jgi:hypothetical protein